MFVWCVCMCRVCVCVCVCACVRVREREIGNIFVGSSHNTFDEYEQEMSVGLSYLTFVSQAKSQQQEKPSVNNLNYNLELNTNLDVVDKFIRFFPLLFSLLTKKLARYIEQTVLHNYIRILFLACKIVELKKLGIVYLQKLRFCIQN